MKVVKVILNIVIPLVLMWLSFATIMGYIAESRPASLDYKWLALLLSFGGYILQYFRFFLGQVIVVAGIFLWFNISTLFY